MSNEPFAPRKVENAFYDPCPTTPEATTSVVRLPLSIGFASRIVISDCVRKWDAGEKLTDAQRAIVDEALVYNRQDLIAAIFKSAEANHAS